MRHVLFSLVAFFSLTAQAAPVCEPIQDLSCAAYPRQAQVIATVTSVEASVVDGQDVCTVSAEPRFYQAHVLCPLGAEDLVTYVMCGACPEVGKEVSGVLMMDAAGSVVLD